MSSQAFQRLAKAISSDQYTEAVTTGFIIDANRKSTLQARFIQKRIFTETIADPFGNSSTMDRTEYAQTQFVLSEKAPHLEIINASRSINPLINRLGELCEGRAAIYPPEKPVSELMEKAAQAARSVKVIGVLISNLQLSATATAKILVKGDEDVKRFLPKLAGDKKYTIDEAQLELTTSSGSTCRITIKENCRFTIQTDKEVETREFLRRLVGDLSE